MKLAFSLAFMLWCLAAAIWLGEIFGYMVPEKKHSAVPYGAL